MTKQEMLDLYRTMFKIRRFEEQAIESFEMAEIPGFVHLSIGQEATEAGACATLNEKDYVTSTHRGHGHIISKGGDLNKMMAELYGKEDGYCHGKGGSMHISNIELGILGANGMVGAGLGLALGGAMAQKFDKSDNVTVCFFGDGASNEGLFHESLNMAALWELPLVYVCENNGYAISTSTKRSMKVQDVAVRAAAYDIPSKIVDGNNAWEVFDACKEAGQHARDGKGPYFIEAKTFKVRGHYEGDPADYRSQEEVDFWKSEAQDPICRMRKYMLENGVTQEEIDTIDTQVNDAIKEAVTFAEDSPFIDKSATLVDVYSDIVEEGRPW